jgi:hypothetical protein
MVVSSGVSCSLFSCIFSLFKMKRLVRISAVSCALDFSVSYPRENTAGSTCFWSFLCSVFLHFFPV